jgi:hypothetical protein
MRLWGFPDVLTVSESELIGFTSTSGLHPHADRRALGRYSPANAWNSSLPADRVKKGC